MRHKKINFHADDLGMTLGCNQAIKEAYDFGILDSASLMTNGLAFDDAITSVIKKCKGLKVGLHLNISETMCNSNDIFGMHHIKNKSFKYKNFFFTFLFSYNKAYMDFLEVEMRLQFEKVVQKLGKIDHVNSHEHFCSVPKIFDILCKLSVEFGVKKIRIPDEPFYFVNFLSIGLLSTIKSYVKWIILKFFSFFNKRSARKHKILFTDCFIGILLSGEMNEENSKTVINKVLHKHKNIEILFHPAKYNSIISEPYFSAKSRNYCLNPKRLEELKTLTSKSFYNFLFTKKIVPYNLNPNSKIKKKYKVCCIFDEEEFYHPKLLCRLIEDKNLEIVGICIIKFKSGSPLRNYLLKNISNLGYTKAFQLGFNSLNIKIKSFFLRQLGYKYFSSCEQVAISKRIKYKIETNIKNSNLKNWIKSLQTDFIVSSNSLIFDNELISIPKIACINRHSSLLPSNKGILPIFRTIEFDQSFTGVTIHKMTSLIDEGDIVEQLAFPIYKKDTLERLYKICFDLSYHLIIQAITNNKKIKKSISPYPSSYNSYPNKKSWDSFNKKSVKFI